MSRASSATARRLAAVLEAELQTSVIALARVMGWRVAHFRPAKTWQGWQTPVGADGKGWPDLLMVRPGQILAAELKSAEGTVTTNQHLWLNALESAGVPTYVWRPKDWTSGAILLVLQRVPVTRPGDIPALVAQEAYTPGTEVAGRRANAPGLGDTSDQEAPRAER
jgi:hypothetical protein